MDAAYHQDTLHLAIETTGRLGSIAVLLGQRVLQQTNLDASRRSAATLAPALEQTLGWCRESNHRLRFVSVADGPGSFTGLRIGVTTAKSLCYALDLPLVSVDSLAAVAAAAMHDDRSADTVLVAIDAYRGQVFAGQFTRAALLTPMESIPANWTAHPLGVRVLSHSAWQAMLRARPASAAIAGDEKPLGELAGSRIDRECDAIGVGLLAIRAAAVGAFIDPLKLVPRYLRPSAAEEKAIKARSASE